MCTCWAQFRGAFFYSPVSSESWKQGSRELWVLPQIGKTKLCLFFCHKSWWKSKIKNFLSNQRQRFSYLDFRGFRLAQIHLSPNLIKVSWDYSMGLKSGVHCWRLLLAMEWKLKSDSSDDGINLSIYCDGVVDIKVNKLGVDCLFLCACFFFFGDRQGDKSTKHRFDRSGIEPQCKRSKMHV